MQWQYAVAVNIIIPQFAYLSPQEFMQQFVDGMKQTPILEYIAVVFGIASVILSRMENIWVYPIGLVSTVIYTYLCFVLWGLYAEASVNIFYTIMSIYGWYLWSKNTGPGQKKQLEITASTKKEWGLATGFFALCWTVLFFSLKTYSNSTVPLADSFAAAAAYTGMLLMARKKVESWIWWIITNLASIPLYFYKGAVFTSFQFLVFLVLAIMGLITWRKKVRQEPTPLTINK